MNLKFKEIQAFTLPIFQSHYSRSQYYDSLCVLEDKSHIKILQQDLYLYTCVFQITLDTPLIALPHFETEALFLIRETNGSFQCLYTHFPDLHAHHQLAQYSNQMQVIFNAIQGGIKVSRNDDTYSYLYVSKELCSLFGYTIEEFMEMSGGSALGAVYPPDAESALRQTAESFDGGSPEYAAKYRIRCKDGTLKWIIDSGRKTKNRLGETIINSLYLDITEIELVNQKIAAQGELLKKERERFRIAIENADMVIFEYDIPADPYSAYGTLAEFHKKQGSSVEREIPQFIASYVPQFASPDSVEPLTKLLLGEAGQTGEFQVAGTLHADTYIWIRATATPVYDDNGRMIKTIGKFINIQSEKEIELALAEANSKDPLTGLYNKETGIRMVQEYMEQKSPEEICGLMIFDMDNFKELNTKQGEIFADAVLQEVAAILRSETGPDDIQIRLGGDEFMLFVKNCNKARATVLGPRIASMICNLFQDELPDVQISASIGMCVTSVVDEYSGLYRCAESTLKYVKSQEKGHAACYLDTSNELGTMLTQVYTDSHFINSIDYITDENDRKTEQEQDLVSFSLELLGKSNNLDDALHLLLARIGRTIHLDRVAILEIDPEYLRCRITHQWDRQASHMKTAQSYYMSPSQYEALCRSYEAGVCTENLLPGSPDMKSFLHAAILNHGTCSGILSFERKDENYQWTKKEIKSIRDLIKTISSFILKARADTVSQAKTEFLSRMSHEIRTPMNAISGMTAIAKTACDNPEKVLDCLAKIETANAYLLTLINDVLDMSKIESGKLELRLEPARLSDRIRELETVLAPQAEDRQIHLCIENQYRADSRLLLDPLRLSQVLINIIGNALKFTPSGGSVTVRIKVIAETSRSVHLHFSVEDSGIGISPQDIDRIFNAFEQAGQNTASSYGGTGLGLSISSRIVQMMGGRLLVESEEGKGSVFSFDLEADYADSDETPVVQQSASVSDAADFRGRRLLLAEDNTLNCEIAESILEMNGFLVECAENGSAAVEAFASHSPYYYDAILMDIRMPVMDGLEATRRIRKLEREDAQSIPIIAMTANAFDSDSKKSIDSGMDGHLSKPLQIEKLLEALKKCLFTENEGQNRMQQK